MESNDFSQFIKECVTAVSEGTSVLRCVLKNYSKMFPTCHDEVLKTPLQIAATLGNLEICKLLIDNGADINVENTEFSSPLTLAASYNHYDIVHFFLEHGADVNRSGAGYVAVFDAAARGYTNIDNLVISYLIKNALECLFKHPELSKDRELSSLLKDELYNLLIINDEHPIRLLLHLKENCVMLQNIRKFIRALTLLSEQQFTVENNETLSYKCHCIGYIFTLTLDFMNSQKPKLESSKISENNILDSLIKSWLVDQPINGHSPALLKILVHESEVYPFKDSEVYRRFTKGMENFCWDYNHCESCETCRKESGLKRCSRCRNVLYCSQTCQTLHWFVHKTECRKSCPSSSSTFKPSEVQG